MPLWWKTLAGCPNDTRPDGCSLKGTKVWGGQIWGEWEAFLSFAVFGFTPFKFKVFFFSPPSLGSLCFLMWEHHGLFFLEKEWCFLGKSTAYLGWSVQVYQSHVSLHNDMRKRHCNYISPPVLSKGLSWFCIISNFISHHYRFRWFILHGI